MFSNTFDPAKSARNKQERGVDFIEARAIWLDPSVRTVNAKLVSGETRFATIGFLGDRLWVAIWANSFEGSPDPEPVIRIISVHRAEKTPFERMYYDHEE